MHRNNGLMEYCFSTQQNHTRPFHTWASTNVHRTYIFAPWQHQYYPIFTLHHLGAGSQKRITRL